MRYIGRAMEECVNAVSAVRFDRPTSPALGMFLYHASVVAEEGAWLGDCDCLL